MYNSEMEKATFGGGCFWCTEAILKRIKGVDSVMSGYAGGKMENPSYEAVSTGETEHAEAIQIIFDTKVISYGKLVEIFFATHDPTTMNRQGADVGTQYRSIIFYHSDNQLSTAEKIKEKVQEKYKDPIVTEIIPFKEFFKAEDYHQDFYAKNPAYGYCTLVIDPKIQKLFEDFKDYVKEEYK